MQTPALRLLNAVISPCRFSTVLAVALLSHAAIAQAPVDPGALLKALDSQSAALSGAWLKSADPRTRAWGAFLAMRNGQMDAGPALLEQLTSYQGGTEGSGAHAAMLAVLDALIQLRVPVPASDAQRIFADFPVQSMVLLSRAKDDTTPALLEIFQSERAPLAARIAAGNLLTRRRAKGFAPVVWKGMTVHATVIVREPGAGYGSGGPDIGCARGRRSNSPVGWPEIADYDFAGCGTDTKSDATILAPGVDVVTYRRIIRSANLEAVDGCGCILDLDVVRQHYLTTLTNAAEEDPPAPAHVSQTIIWKGAPDYLQRITALIASQQSAFAKLAERLVTTGAANAQEMQGIRPALRIVIFDERTNRSTSLPALPPLDSNVSVERN